MSGVGIANLIFNLMIFVIAIIILVFLIMNHKKENYIYKSPLEVENPPFIVYRNRSVPIGNSFEFGNKSSKIMNDDMVPQGQDYKSTKAVLKSIKEGSGNPDAYIKKNKPIVIEPSYMSQNPVTKVNENYPVLNPASYDVSLYEDKSNIGWKCMPYLDVNTQGKAGNYPFLQNLTSYGDIGPTGPNVDFMKNTGIGIFGKNPIKSRSINEIINKESASIGYEIGNSINGLNGCNNTNPLYSSKEIRFGGLF